MRIDGEQRIKLNTTFMIPRRKGSLNTTLSRSNSNRSTMTLDLNDPTTYRPQTMETHAAALWSYAILGGWMTKHMPPAFSFTKTRHRRYVLLLDRHIYTFKTDSPKSDFREHFQLTANTDVFATDQFPGVLYCLEIARKEDGRTWYLQADDAEDMKTWMDRFRKAIKWLRLEQPGVFTISQLLEMDRRSSESSNIIFDTTFSSSSTWRQRQPLPRDLPPQRPPPTRRPPPPPSCFS
ncbi:hypothetical protein K492DRAFT_173278 [Lichtheimia hyalospora FSU 10163]|nr:hypothetical protein K492DRAFT_173278 [Lichtheimia hyalospora FSU 10163]